VQILAAKPAEAAFMRKQILCSCTLCVFCNGFDCTLKIHWWAFLTMEGKPQCEILLSPSLTHLTFNLYRLRGRCCITENGGWPMNYLQDRF